MSASTPSPGAGGPADDGESKSVLGWLVDRLEEAHGAAPPPLPTDAFELVLWENVAYLVSDARRREAFESLRRSVGTRPEDVLAASPDDLVEVARHGILPETFGPKIRQVAEIAVREFPSGLTELLRGPVQKAKRGLRVFPGIGEPGAEKILLLTRSHPFLAPESNGLRVLVRFGLCDEGKSYSATYAFARELAAELGDDYDRLISARHVLKTHGQTVCRRKTPACASCSVRDACAFDRAVRQGRTL